MLDKYLSKNVEKSSLKDKKQAAKSEDNKNYDDTLREKIGPGFTTKAVENDITYGSTTQQTQDAVLDGSLTKLLKYAKDMITDGSLTKLLKYAIPDASTRERLKSFLPDGLTTEQVKGFILLAMAASAQRIGGVEVPRPTSSALDLWNNNPAYDGNASLPVCPIGSEHLTEYRNAPFIVDQKHIQELNQKFANPPFFFEGPKDAQGTSDEKTSQSAMEAPSHQLEQSESKQLALKDSQDVPSSKEIEDITKLIEKYQSYCGKLRFSKAFIEAVKDQTNMKYPFSTWYDQHPRRMETSKALSCSNPKSELLRRLLDDKTYKDIVASALQTFEDREYGLDHRYDPLSKKVYDHGYHAGNRDGWDEGYNKGFYDYIRFYGNGHEEMDSDGYKEREHDKHKSRWKEEFTEKILKEAIDAVFCHLNL